MDLYSLLLIALALSLDAFGIAISIGLNKSATKGFKICCIISFAAFQFLFSFIGAYSGFLFNKYIASVPEIIGGIIIILVGALMLKEGIDNKEELTFLKPGMWFILGISVSIDAMVVGFTALNNIPNNLIILKDTLFIGFTTLVITSLAFIISKYLKRIQIISKYADYIGGIILILFGFKMMFF
ncbi:manganese efflux pump [Clostridium rectalis]|uniref:manganese efflux pump n=1 Tax=Clostridium rectalis TaxID=2040295 RepID=UPI000F639264|nr:manganese efflux pump [Clostridium rectalis]